MTKGHYQDSAAQFVPKGYVRFSYHRWVGDRLATASICVEEDVVECGPDITGSLVIRELLVSIERLKEKS